MALKKRFKVTRTVDADTKEEEVTVEDMDTTEEEKKEEDKVVDMEETMDAGEYKEVMDMCKDMGYESIKDMANAHKEMKDADPENEDEENTKDKKGKAKDSLAIRELEKQVATLPKGKARDAAIAGLRAVKDATKGYVNEEGIITKGLAEHVEEINVKTTDEKPEFVDYGKIIGQQANAQRK